MGMESFNAEPVVPDVSERIDDVDKARAMADASDSHRTSAMESRKVAAGDEKQIEEDWGDLKVDQMVNGWTRQQALEHAKSQASGLAENKDKWAEDDEAKAAKAFDYEKKKE